MSREVMIDEVTALAAPTLEHHSGLGNRKRRQYQARRIRCFAENLLAGIRFVLFENDFDDEGRLENDDHAAARNVMRPFSIADAKPEASSAGMPAARTPVRARRVSPTPTSSSSESGSTDCASVFAYCRKSRKISFVFNSASGSADGSAGAVQRYEVSRATIRKYRGVNPPISMMS